MATTERPHLTWDLVHDSGEPRPDPSARTDTVMTVLSVWFTLGLFLDAYAHANFPDLETFFTPWHAVFYSGFAATAGWVLWTVWQQVRLGRRGRAAVPVGYGLTVLALPAFVVSGAADLTWHTLLGIETDTDIFFSPSHLGLIVSMVVILTSPLRSAWTRPAPTRTAVLTLAFATSLVLLFLTYGNALLFGPGAIVRLFSESGRGNDGAGALAVRLMLTTVVLLAPLLLLARRWFLPTGAATAVFTFAAVISGTLTGFRNNEIALAVIAAGILVDVLARGLAPSGARRAAFWAFAFAAPVITWAAYLGVASAVVGRLPAITEFWTGAPIVAGLVGLLLGVLMLPNAQPPAASG